MKPKLQKKMIVAEITKNWPWSEGVDPTLLSQRFEQVIEVNDKRGFRLNSWRLSCLHVPAGRKPEGIVETIIAVFEEK